MDGDTGTTLSTTPLILHGEAESQRKVRAVHVLYGVMPCNKIMPCTSPILPGPETNPYYDLPQENDEEGQPMSTVGPKPKHPTRGLASKAASLEKVPLPSRLPVYL